MSTDCASCDEHATLACSGCNTIRYCSQACQKADWSIHKIICKKYKEFLLTSPGPDHHSAIYFSPDKPQPRFIWVRYEHGHDHPSLESLSGLGFGGTEGLNEVSHNVMLARHSEPHHIVLSLPEVKNLCPCCTSYQKPNKSLIKVDEEVADFFRGPVLAFGKYCKGNPVHAPSDLDLGPMAFRHVVNALRHIYCQCEDETRLIFHNEDLRVNGITAVRLNCVGDKYFLKRPTFESVREVASSPSTATYFPTPVADKIGLPLIVRQVPPAVLWRDLSRPSRLENGNASMLNPPHQLTDTGSLVLARKDGVPLLPVHVQAIISYTAEKLKLPCHPNAACVSNQNLDVGCIEVLSKDDFKRWYATE